MNTFIDNMIQPDTTTENGMPAYRSSGEHCLDLFYSLGTRSLTEAEVVRLFSLAFAEDRLTAVKTVFYNRDCRGGRGERESFRVIMRWMSQMTPSADLVRLIPVFGRWDDLLCFFGTPWENTALSVIGEGLQARDRLCAKWMPRKGENANILRKFLRLSPKQYRKMLVNLTTVVETPMCANRWNDINFSHVPSQAGRIYSKAFARHTPEEYSEWKESLQKGDTKINVGQLYPHEIIGKLFSDYPAEEAWKTLGDKYPSTSKKILPVCDVSGSMMSGNSNVVPLHVCIALGIFLSERNTGPFKDVFCTFSARPELEKLSGNLKQKYNDLSRADWGMNTDINKVFDLILKAAKKSNPSDIPEFILILSDMQFDACVTGETAFERYSSQFAAIGVPVPKSIFWNLNFKGNVPVKHNEEGVALVSGFSPSVLETIVTSPDRLTPAGMMQHTLSNKRYDAINDVAELN
jgi:hypothetical protein